MHQASFVSDDFDPGLQDHEKFAHWCENIKALTCCVDITRAEDRRFSAFVHWADYAHLQVTRFGGKFSRIRRSKTAISRGPDDDFCLMFHRGSGALRVDQVGRETTLPSKQAFLGTNGLPVDMQSDADFSSTTLTVSRARLLTLVNDVDALLVNPLDESRPVARICVAISIFPWILRAIRMIRSSMSMSARRYWI